MLNTQLIALKAQVLSKVTDVVTNDSVTPKIIGDLLTAIINNFGTVDPSRVLKASIYVKSESGITVFVIGKTYSVYADPADDFTNIGFLATNVAFVATGTTPTRQSINSSVTLSEPAITVFKNTIGYFTSEYVYSNNTVKLTFDEPHFLNFESSIVQISCDYKGKVANYVKIDNYSIALTVLISPDFVSNLNMESLLAYPQVESVL